MYCTYFTIQQDMTQKFSREIWGRNFSKFGNEQIIILCRGLQTYFTWHQLSIDMICIKYVLASDLSDQKNRRGGSIFHFLLGHSSLFSLSLSLINPPPPDDAFFGRKGRRRMRQCPPPFLPLFKIWSASSQKNWEVGKVGNSNFFGGRIFPRNWAHIRRRLSKLEP